jgi:peptidoglycan/xylan/chitin deacetylase (PgdA/CDA1 family)
MESRRPLGLALLVVTTGASVLAGQGFAEPWAATRKPDCRAVPVLMYHVIADPPLSAPYPDLYVRREELQAQVRWLAAAGYEAVTLGRVFDAWRGRATLPPRPIVLTFDDGYRSQVTAALPILAAQRWPGVLNLDVSNLAPPWGVGLVGVRKLIAAGWAIDAHSLTHADLASASGAALTREVSGSRREIRRLFGVLPRFFCYPAGRYDVEAVAAVEAAGYEGATTTEPGLARPDEPFTLARIRVDRGDGAAGLAQKLAQTGLPVDPRGRSARRRQLGAVGGADLLRGS